jgi:uncharacterized lipoprotein YmbA
VAGAVQPAARALRAMFAMFAMFVSLALLPLLAACAGAPVPPTTWLRLPAEAAAMPGTAAATMPARDVTRDPARPGPVWQLMLPVPLPAHLDRDSLFVPSTLQSAGTLMQPLAGARWVEPLRDALPRLLREDLVRALGQPLWQAPLPPGLAVTQQLRVEITAFEIAADGRSLLTQARWTLADARGAQPPRVHEARFETAAASGAAEAWALAHRTAIALLASRIAATMTM